MKSIYKITYVPILAIALCYVLTSCGVRSPEELIPNANNTSGMKAKSTYITTVEDCDLYEVVYLKGVQIEYITLAKCGQGKTGSILQHNGKFIKKSMTEM